MESYEQKTFEAGRCIDSVLNYLHCQQIGMQRDTIDSLINSSDDIRRNDTVSSIARTHRDDQRMLETHR